MGDAIELLDIKPKRGGSEKRKIFLSENRSSIKRDEVTSSNSFACRQASIKYLTSSSSRQLHSVSTLDQTVRYGNILQIQKCLENLSQHKATAINQINHEDGLAPIHVSARYGDAEVAKLLLDNGANTHLIGNEGVHAIHLAAKFYKKSAGRYTKSVGSGFKKIKNNATSKSLSKKSCLQLLIDYGADINAKDKFKSSPLHYACDKGHLQAVEILLSSRNAVLNIQNDQKSTPLHEAAGHGHAEIVKKILSIAGDESGNLIKAVDENNSTALILACRDGYKQVAEVLLKTAALSQNVLRCLLDRDLDQSTALHASVESGHVETVRFLLDAFDKEIKRTNHSEKDPYLGEYKRYVDLPRGDGNTPLHIAAEIGVPEMLIAITDKEPWLNPKNNTNATPLFLAAQRNNIPCLQYLLDKGCDTEIVDIHHLSPLLVACKSGNDEAVKILIQHGADLHATDYFSRNSLFLAVLEGNLNIVQSLLSCSTRHTLLHECDRFGNTVLHECARQGYLETMKVFIDAGLKLDCRNDMEQTPLHFASKNGQRETVKEIVSLDRSTLNDQNDRSRTALHLAASEGHVKTVKELIKLGAATGDVDFKAWTPLHTCVSAGWTECAETLIKADRSLLKCKTRYKETVLHLACYNNKPDMVKLLLEWNVDVTARLPDGRNALDVAIDKLHEQCAIALIENENWIKSMKNAILPEKSMAFLEWSRCRKVRTPLRRLIESMPDVAELALTKCMKINDNNFSSSYLKVKFNYELLEDMYEIEKWKHETSDYAHVTKKEDILHSNTHAAPQCPDLKPNNCETYKNTSFSVNVVEDKQGSEEPKKMDMKNEHIGKEDKLYDTDTAVLEENHPLSIMVKEKRVKLLSHPIVRSLVNYKERKYVQYLFLANDLCYAMYLILLTYYMCTTPPRFAIDEERTRENVAKGMRCIRVVPKAVPVWTDACQDRTPYRYATLTLIVAFSAFQLLKEILQLMHLRIKYFYDFVNYLEWALYSLSILTFIDFDSLAKDTGIRQQWQWQCGAFAVLLGFINLCLYLRRTRLGIYVFMMVSVGKSFLRFAPIMIICLLGFSFSFYILLQNQISFNTPLPSIVKAFVMVIGEFDYERIFLSGFNNTEYEDRVNYTVSTNMVFIAFVIVMSLMLANLLIGIAVDDISSVYYQASLRQFTVEVEGYLGAEYLFPECIRRCFVIRWRTYEPNKHLKRNAIYRWFAEERDINAEYIRRSIGIAEKPETERICEELDLIKSSVNRMTSGLHRVAEQQDKIKEQIMTVTTKINQLSLKKNFPIEPSSQDI